jgi:hypothetical protein
MKRFLAPIAVLGTGAAMMLAAAPAGAATGSTICNTGLGSQNQIGGTITANLDVPAGASCQMGPGSEVTGNVTVEGTLHVYGAHFDKNVTVNGGSFVAGNQGARIEGNLSITNSNGEQNGFWSEEAWWDTGQTGSYVRGNFIYTGNSAPLWVGYGTTQVGKNFNYSSNTHAPDQIWSLRVAGNSNIS